jgi:hypothetical protein
MEQISNRLTLTAVLVEAANLTPEERRRRITRCVAEGRHVPDQLPYCVASSNHELIRYCDRCWSVIDPYGRTWSWTPGSTEKNAEPEAVGP